MYVNSPPVPKYMEVHFKILYYTMLLFIFIGMITVLAMAYNAYFSGFVILGND